MSVDVMSYPAQSSTEEDIFKTHHHTSSTATTAFLLPFCCSPSADSAAPTMRTTTTVKHPSSGSVETTNSTHPQRPRNNNTSTKEPTTSSSSSSSSNLSSSAQQQQQPSGSSTSSASGNGGKQRRGPSSVDPENGPYMVQNAVAVALIMKLSHWCAQLFLLTIFCLTNCGGPTFRKGASAEEKRTATFQEVRRSILYASSQRRLNTVTEMEMKLLRHLTCPQTAILRSLRPSCGRRRHYPSRPPSPQIFDIQESDYE